ncbi:MAG: tetratricopeptide repeat protein, partial [Alphaproteobacteria bacterium]
VLEERAHEPSQASQAETDAQGWLDRGRLLVESGDSAGALRAYDAAALIDPRLPGLDRSRAEACLASGLFSRGLEAIDRQLRATPSDPRALVLRARLLAKMGRHADAVAAWDRLLAGRARPEPDHVVERAQACVASGDLPAALRGLDEGRARLGAVPAIDHLAVDLEVRRGDFDGALRRIDRAMKGQAPRGPWELRRGEVLEAAGRREAAREAYAAALAEAHARAARGRAVPPEQELRARDGLGRTGPMASPSPSPGSGSGESAASVPPAPVAPRP